MEAATPLHKPHVSTHGDRVKIDGLVVVDDALVRLVQEEPEPEKIVTDAIEIGARVLDREQTAANAEFVKTEFEKVSRTVEAEFGEKARATAEQLGDRLDEVFDPDRGQLARLFDESFSEGSSKAVQNQIRDAVKDLLQASREDLVKLFASGDASNPLAELRARTIDEIRAADKRQREGHQVLVDHVHELEKQLQGLRDEKEKQEELARERERGTAKGRSYEEAVAEAVDRIASVHGDTADAVGDERGSGGKRGDVVVGIDGCSGADRGRIVFEAKDSQLSKPRFYDELDSAKDQRDADFAVLVVPGDDEVPARLHALREYQGDKMIAVYDPNDGSALELEFVYRVARARVAAVREGSHEVDSAQLRATVARAVAAMDDIRRVKSQLTTAQNGIGGARDMLVALEERVRSELSQLDEALTPADADGELASVDGQTSLPDA
jgi:hypothetical protein